MVRLCLVAALCQSFLSVPARAEQPDAGAAAATDRPHPLNVRDLVSLRRLSDPQVSPDGRHVVYVLRSTDLDANKGRTDLWMVDLDGKNSRQLTAHPDADVNPRWSADGKSIYFLSSRSGSMQVWRLPVDGGESVQVTDLSFDVGALNLSPDGTQLCIAIEVFPGKSIEESKKRLDDEGKRKSTGRVYDKLFFRHWDAWKDGRRSHLFVLPAAGGKPVDLMKEMDADAPSRPFGGPEEYAFAPDGTSVVFTARDVGREEAWSTNLDLFAAPIDGSAAPRRLTEGNKATDTQPLFSPDGKTLAYLAMSRAGYEADRYRILLREWPSGSERELAADWDRSADSLLWSADGKSLYATAQHVGQHSLFAIDVAGGAPREIVREGTVQSPVLAGNDIVYSMNHLRGPADLYVVSPAGSGGGRKLTDVNADPLRNIQFGDAEQFSFKGAKGDDVYCYVVRPVGFDAAKKYPVAFLIHGGPQGSFGNDFHYRWNPQIYAGAGYAAVMVDFHGSTGYGQAFTDAIRGHWGSWPLEDLQKGLAAAIAKYSWMDGERVAALGASYGGYMINWIEGNWPDRFRCLVSHDGNLDEHMAYYDTEELWFPEWEHGGTPWDNPESYDKESPMRFVKNWKTPMLVIHGGQDFRVVDTHGMSVFTALQRKGIPSKFLHFPDENHWVLKPQNSILWHDTVLAWLDEWTKK